MGTSALSSLILFFFFFLVCGTLFLLVPAPHTLLIQDRAPIRSVFTRDIHSRTALSPALSPAFSLPLSGWDHCTLLPPLVSLFTHEHIFFTGVLTFRLICCYSVHCGWIPLDGSLRTSAMGILHGSRYSRTGLTSRTTALFGSSQSAPALIAMHCTPREDHGNTHAFSLSRSPHTAGIVSHGPSFCITVFLVHCTTSPGTCVTGYTTTTLVHLWNIPHT